MTYFTAISPPFPRSFFAKPKFDRSAWRRKRYNRRMWGLVREPIGELEGSVFFPWKYTSEGWVYNANPTWDDAVAEFHRRYDRYMQLLPPVGD
jgi:hypothetical protein